jgi:exonuclease SbcC
MIIKQIDMTNFLAYKDPGPLSLEGMHIACLTGDNGAGKSSILDAVTWAIWNKARGSSVDDLVRSGEDEMNVSVVFEQTEKIYRVTRQRKISGRGTSGLSLEVKLEDDWVNATEATIRDTQSKIERILRLDYNTFVNSAYIAQGKADEFTNKTPAQRKEILSEILGLFIWKQFEDKAKELEKNVLDKGRSIESNLSEIEPELSKRDSYKTNLESAQEDAKQAAIALEELEAQWQSVEAARAEIKSTKELIRGSEKNLISAQRELKDAEQELKRLQGLMDTETIKSELESVRGQMTEYEEVEANLLVLETHIKTVQLDIAEFNANKNSVKQRAEELKQKLAKVENLAAECPVCGQELSEDHKTKVVSEFNSRIEQLRSEYRSFQDGAQNKSDELKPLNDEAKEVRATLAEREQASKRIGVLEQKLSQASEAAKAIENIESKQEHWQTEIGTAQSETGSSKEKLAELEKTLESDIDENRVKSARSLKQSADISLGVAKEKMDNLTKLEKRYAQLKIDFSDLQTEREIYTKLKEAFGKKGVPAMIIETAVPELEESANSLLSKMTDGRMSIVIETQKEIKSGELREALDIVISDQLGQRPYENYSGGEAFRINFAIRIALSKLLARRAGAQLRSLFIDEGFGSQDAQGRQKLVAAINDIQNDFDLILVITHIDELKNAFPDRINVTKTPSGSEFLLS